MDDLVEWLTDENYTGPMQHLRDWLEIDLRHAQAADALATRDARIVELTEQRDTALAAMQILADRLKEAERVVTAAIAENYMMVEEGRKHEADLVKRTFYHGVAAAIDTLEIYFLKYKDRMAQSDIRT